MQSLTVYKSSGQQPAHRPGVSRSRRGEPRRTRRGFSLIELLIALGITAALLTATLVALNASFMAYQNTTEVASTHTIGRLTMHRMLAMIRVGKDFGPFPTNPLDTTLTSDFIEFETPEGDFMTLEFDESNELLQVTVTDGDTAATNTYTLLEGVVRQLDGDGDPIPTFTMQYEKGRNLYRATIDLMIQPDDNMSVSLDGHNATTIRLVASAMPRLAAY
jgi:prepilin-type N-terminal cleavage/methylation domain-containing protein